MADSLYEFKKKQSMHNYLDAEVRQFARMHEMDANETWELRVKTLARMLAGVLNERESNSSDFEILVDPVGDCWSERLIGLIDERTRTMSQEEFLEKMGE